MVALHHGNNVIDFLFRRFFVKTPGTLPTIPVLWSSFEAKQEEVEDEVSGTGNTAALESSHLVNNCQSSRFLTSYSLISPFYNNVIVSLVMVMYFKFALELISWIRIRLGGGDVTNNNNLHRCISKQLYYILLTSCLGFWPFFDTNDWSWRLNVIVPCALLIRNVYKGAIAKDSEDIEVQALSLSSSPTELLLGPTQFSLVMIFLGLYKFMSSEGVVIMAATGFGDSIAPIIGALFGRHIYQFNPFAPFPKTMEGSIVGVFLGTVSVTYLLLYALDIPLFPLRVILAYSAIAAVTEGTSPGNCDNVLVPMVLHFSMERVQHWLPE